MDDQSSTGQSQPTVSVPSTGTGGVGLPTDTPAAPLVPETPAETPTVPEEPASGPMSTPTTPTAEIPVGTPVEGTGEDSGIVGVPCVSCYSAHQE